MNDQRPKKSPEIESLERLRRIETRLTTLSIGLGIDTTTRKPIFAADEGPATIQLPSIDCSMKSIVACIPPDWVGHIDVRLGDEVVTTIAVVDRT